MRGTMRRLLSVMAAALVVVAASAHVRSAGAAPAARETVARIDAYLRGLVRTDAFEGSVLIARAGRVLLERGYGLADRSKGVGDTPGTRYRIFDLTRQFTAMAILRLQDAGTLSVQDAFCRYLSGCPSRWQSITIHQLLSNSSGIPDFTQLGAFKLASRETPSQIVGMTEGRPLRFRPGTQFGYSNTDYVLLGLVIEALSGEPYMSYLQSQILRPLGMAGSGLLRDGEAVSGLAKGYANTSQAKQVDATTPWAAGGMYSTVKDMYLWDQALAGRQVATAKALQEMFTPYVSIPPESQIGYGYGWIIGPLWKHNAVFHGGGSLGYQSLNLMFPADRLTVIILSNQGETDVGSIESAIVPDLLR